METSINLSEKAYEFANKYSTVNEQMYDIKNELRDKLDSLKNELNDISEGVGSPILNGLRTIAQDAKTDVFDYCVNQVESIRNAAQTIDFLKMVIDYFTPKETKDTSPKPSESHFKPF